MSKVVIAKNPNLSFLIVGKKTIFNELTPLPLILKENGTFDWNANGYITHYAGGARTYNLKPLASTVSKRAYNLNIFCDFLDNRRIELHLISNDTMYRYVDELKKRCITDDTITSHVRTALDYIIYLNNCNPQWHLATDKIEAETTHRVHYSIHSYRSGRYERKYFSHSCLNGLNHIHTEAEFVRDDEYLKWLDAINHTGLHPTPDDFLIARWRAFGTLLEITGSRISEINLITTKMIKTASSNMLDPYAGHVIKNIPIAKGKYKGNTRNIPVTKEDLQVIMLYIYMMEERFPGLKHDGLFIDTKTGSKLTHSYLKNYARKVINDSPYAQELRHITNHSFRHRYITLNIAMKLNELSQEGSFTNILVVAANVCRKLTMHASDKTLAHYVHLASDINVYGNLGKQSNKKLSSHIQARVLKIINISDKLQSNLLNNTDALDQLIAEAHELKKLQIGNPH